MHTIWNASAALCCVALLLYATAAQTNTLNSIALAKQNLSSLDFKNRSLDGILWLFQQAGFNIIYSDQLVHREMVITENPSKAAPLERLSNTLSVFFLRLEKDEYSETWYLTQAVSKERYRHLNIFDSNTGSPLDGVDIVYQNKTLGTSKQGEYKLFLPRTDMEVSLQAKKYQAKTIRPFDLSFNAGIGLTPLNTIQDEITVTASQYHVRTNQAVSNNVIHDYDLEYLPLRGNDTVQVLNLLPGVASNGVSAAPNIRGGAADELLILFDDIKLTNPFHLKDFNSLVSAINNDVVENVNIYTGGFPAQFGSKLSGVLEITPIQHYREQKNSLDWNLFASSIKLVGTSRENRLQGLIAARRGNVSDTLDEINEDLGTPRFSDTFLTGSFQLNERLRFSASSLILQDDIVLNNLDASGNGEQATSDYSSIYSWVKVNYQPNNRTNNQWAFSYTDIESRRNGKTYNDANPSGSQGELYDKRSFHIASLGYQGWFEINPNSRLHYGLHFEEKLAYYDYIATARLGELATLLGNSRNIDRTYNNKADYQEFHAFFNYQFNYTQALEVILGIRADKENLSATEGFHLSPRLAALYRLSEKLTLKASSGRYIQTADVNELTIGDDAAFYELPQQASHYIWGLDYDLSSNLTASLESFYKEIRSPKTRYENIFNNYRLLPDIAADRIEIDPQTAHARGFEIKLNYIPSSDLSAQFSYSLSKATDTVNQQRIYRTWNQLHSLQSSINWVSWPWSVTATGVWHMGWRSTGFPQRIPDLVTPVSYNVNDTKLPNFYAINVKTSRVWELRNSDLKLYLDISNITDQNNIGYYDVSFVAQSDGSYEVQKEPGALLPILPSIGINWSF